jgi:hypothetical protein
VLELSARGASSLLQLTGEPTRTEGIVIRGPRHVEEETGNQRPETRNPKAEIPSKSKA